MSMPLCSGWSVFCDGVTSLSGCFGPFGAVCFDPFGGMSCITTSSCGGGTSASARDSGCCLAGTCSAPARVPPRLPPRCSGAVAAACAAACTVRVARPPPAGAAVADGLLLAVRATRSLGA